jgi:hypothetical protein
LIQRTKKRREGNRGRLALAFTLLGHCRLHLLSRVTKIQFEFHHGKNALLSSIIGAFYVRFDPPTTAPSGIFEKCTKNGDDDDDKT